VVCTEKDIEEAFGGTVGFQPRDTLRGECVGLVARVLTCLACVAIGLELACSAPQRGTQKTPPQFRVHTIDAQVSSRSLRDDNGEYDYEDRDQFFDTFPSAISSDAAIACRDGSVYGCKCTDGTTARECCVDGNLTNNGTTGGSLAEGTSFTSWRRDNTEWYCTEHNDCTDFHNQEHSGNSDYRGADIVFAPNGASCSSPRLLYVHGGSWLSYSPNETGYFHTASRLAAETGAVVMSIDYPIPGTCYNRKHLEKGGICDARSNFSVLVSWTIAALEYFAANVPAIDGVSQIPLGGCHNEPGEGPPILISGDSSGAGTAYSTLLSLAKGGPRTLNGGRDKLAGGIFFSGFFDLQCNTIGYMEKFYNAPDKNGGGYWNQGSTDGASGKTPPSSWAQTPAEYAWYNCRKLAKNYMGNLEGTTNPYASTVLANAKMLQDLPPLLFSVAGAYALSTEAHIVAQNAAAANRSNEVYLDVYDGMMHDFQMYSWGCGSGNRLWQADMAWNRTAAFVKHVNQTGHAPCYRDMPRGFPVTTSHIENPNVINLGAEGEDWLPYSGGSFGCNTPVQ